RRMRCGGSCVGCDAFQPRYPFGARSFGQVAVNRAPFVCHRPAGDQRFTDGTALAAAGIRCCAAWPLVCDNSTVGLLVIYSREDMSDPDLQQVSLLARRAAPIIVNAVASERLRRRVAQ